MYIYVTEKNQKELKYIHIISSFTCYPRKYSFTLLFYDPTYFKED